MRLGLTFAILAIGVILGFVSYFVLAAHLGTPTNPSFSDPSVPYAATLFVLGIVIVSVSPLVYELLPGVEGE